MHLAPPHPGPEIHVTTRAAVERALVVDGRREMRLGPANHIVAGDLVVYTLEVRNLGPTPATAVVVTAPIPEPMRYFAGSAVGPGAQISYSVDGGHHYGAPDRLRVRDADGHERPAIAADYTNLRWVLEDPLQSGSIAFLRYVAVLR